MARIIAATQNKHKIKEIEAIFDIDGFSFWKKYLAPA